MPPLRAELSKKIALVFLFFYKLAQNMTITWESYDSSTQYEYNMGKMYLTGRNESIPIRVCVLFDSRLGRGVDL